MSQFPDIKDLIMKCFSFPTFKVREMAVKAIFPLTSTKELLEDAITFLDAQIRDLNLVHGHLLLLSEILKKSGEEEIIMNMRKHCVKWTWINMLECDLIQALYFDVCHGVYFGILGDHNHFEARKKLWNLSQKGLKEPLSTRLSSYGSLTSKTRIYLSGFDEFSSEANVVVLDLIRHSFYEVQIAAFESLISMWHCESLDLPALLETCFCLLRTRDTKEEVLRCASDFLGKHSKSIQSEYFLASDISLYENNIVADHLIDVYLPSLGSIIASVIFSIK
jgi:hypothetical protein